MKQIDEDEYAGFTPEEAVRRMTKAGADVVGVNCSDGPQGVFETVKRMLDVSKKPVSAMPNAGMPQMVQGRMLYLATPEYMAEYARRYAQMGVVLIGGCCGTTPKHIREMKRFLKPLRPSMHAEVVREEKKEELPVGMPPKPLCEKSPFGAVLGKKFAISVEIDPPLGISPVDAVEGAKFLKGLGVDAVNIADGPRAVPRMSPMALGAIIKDKAGIEPIVHYCCRDRNILGMQMDLLGAAALELNNMLIITGDPPKMGHYPDATAVFDIDSIGLIRFASNLNRGLDFASRPLKGATSLVIGCGCNPGAVDIDIEADRFRKKVEAGAEFAFSQPVYDLKILEKFFEKIKNVKKIPFFVGILPLASLKNAEFLHNEVPGMQIPAKIMDRMRKETARDGWQKVGLDVASEIIGYARSSVKVGGAYIFPPFGNYRLVERLLR
jgi:homocysteine S-methyltransferase